jgi:hypothetical protein
MFSNQATVEREAADDSAADDSAAAGAP